MRFAVSNRTIQIVNAVFHDFVGNILCFRFSLVQPNASDLWIYEGGSWNDGVIHLEFLESAKQCVDSGIPSLVRSHMSELIGAGHIASSKNVGVERL